MRKTLEIIGWLALADLAILFTGLAQVAQELNPYFNSFWLIQAQFFLKLVN